MSETYSVKYQYVVLSSLYLYFLLCFNRYMVKLPGTTPEGYEVFLSKLIRTEPEHYVLADLIKTYNMHADIWYKQNGTSPGIVYFIDMNGFSLGHVCKLNLNIVKHHLSYLQVIFIFSFSITRY